MNIVLIGFMGTGKSVVGRALARRLEARHRDTDAELERVYHKPIRHLFADNGETWFRRAETEMLRQLMERLDDRTTVISTGGGTPLLPENEALLRQIGPIVCLSAPAETILSRVVRNLDQRPLLAAHRADPLARIQALLAERTPRYAEIADYTIDTTPFSMPDDVAAHIISRLQYE